VGGGGSVKQGKRHIYKDNFYKSRPIYTVSEMIYLIEALSFTDVASVLLLNLSGVAKNAPKKGAPNRTRFLEIIFSLKKYGFKRPSRRCL
jgi:hypothetical protein